MKTKDRKIKNEIVPLSFELNSIRYEGEATPLSSSCRENVCFELNVDLIKNN